MLKQVCAVQLEAQGRKYWRQHYAGVEHVVYYRPTVNEVIKMKRS